MCFVTDVTVSPSPRTPWRTGNSEPADCRAFVSEARPAAQELPSCVSKSHPVSREIQHVFVLPAAHMWTKARFVPRCLIAARSVCLASFVVS